MVLLSLAKIVPLVFAPIVESVNMTLEEIFVCRKVSKYSKMFKTCFPTNPSFQMMRYLYVVVFPFLVNTAMLGFAPLVASAHGVLQKLNVKVSKFSKVLESQSILFQNQDLSPQSFLGVIILKLIQIFCIQ